MHIILQLINSLDWVSISLHSVANLIFIWLIEKASRQQNKKYWTMMEPDSASAGVNICLANLAKDQHFL